MKYHYARSGKANSTSEESLPIKLGLLFIVMIVTLAIVQSYFGPYSYTREEKKEFVMRNPGTAYWLLPCDTDNPDQ